MTKIKKSVKSKKTPLFSIPNDQLELLIDNLCYAFVTPAVIKTLIDQTNLFLAEDITNVFYQLTRQYYHNLYQKDFDDLLFDEEYEETYDKIQEQAIKHHLTCTRDELDYQTCLNLLDVPKDYRLYHFDRSQLIRHKFTDSWIRRKFPISYNTYEEDILIVITNKCPISFLDHLMNNDGKHISQD